jgi:hypothetical protein
MLLAALLWPAAAVAGIVSLSGDISITPTPISLVYSDDFGPTTPFNTENPVIFAEHVAFPIPVFSALDPIFAGVDFFPVDFSAPGTYSPDIRTPASLASGLVVDTFIVHFQPLDQSDTIKVRSGSITFDSDIIGLKAEMGPVLRERAFPRPPSI